MIKLKQFFILLSAALLTAPPVVQSRQESPAVFLEPETFQAPEQTSDIVFLDPETLIAASYKNGSLTEMGPAAQGFAGPVRAEYFSDKNLGKSAVRREESKIYFPFGYGSPEGVPNDGFSARWQAVVVPAFSEEYTFYTRTDDGVRLTVNGKRIIDKWRDMGTTEYTGSISLRAGRQYKIVMEYYEGGGPGHAELGWSGPNTPKEIISQAGRFSEHISAVAKEGWAGPLRAEYFKGTDLKNSVLKREESGILYNYGNGSPHPKVPKDRFSARWTGKIKAARSENYTFYTITDDGVRLYLDGRRILDEWRGMSPTEHRTTVKLEAGRTYDLVMEYMEYGGGAYAELGWMSESMQRNNIGTLGQKQAVSRVVATGPFTGRVFAADFTGDGRKDVIALSNAIPGEAHIFQNTKDGLLPVQTLDAGFDPKKVVFSEGSLYILTSAGIRAYTYESGKFKQVWEESVSSPVDMAVIGRNLYMLSGEDKPVLARIRNGTGKAKTEPVTLPQEISRVPFTGAAFTARGIALFTETEIQTYSVAGRPADVWKCNHCRPVSVHFAEGEIPLIVQQGSVLKILNSNGQNRSVRTSGSLRCAVNPKQSRQKDLYCLSGAGEILKISL